MKGFFVSIGVTVMVMVIMVVMVTVAIFIVVFAFNHQIKFSVEYASIVNKPYSVSEPLFLKSVDDRNILDHSLGLILIGGAKNSEIGPGSAANDIKLFMDLYNLKYYSVEIKKEDVILKRSSAQNFCGTLDNNNNIANTCGPDHNQPCIAYCEPVQNVFQKTANYISGASRGICSARRTEYSAGNSICQADSKNSICCIEAGYDWTSKKYTGVLYPGEKICSQGKGVCAPVCESGRDVIQSFDDRSCEYIYYSWASLKQVPVTRSDHCCSPRNPDASDTQNENAESVSIPILYKKTQLDEDGVKGYITVGVSSD